jgi:GTPase Era involved in 16S rRNA processing
MQTKKGDAAADVIRKKLGEVLREKTIDTVNEELPDDIKKLLERMQPNPKAS